MPTFEWRCGEDGEVFETEGRNYDQAKDLALQKCEDAVRHFSAPTGMVSEQIGSLSIPTWYKDRISKMNSDLSTNVKMPK